MESTYSKVEKAAREGRRAAYHAHRHALRLFRKLQSGQSMTEYALILALVVVVGLATWASLGSKITATVQEVVNCL